MSSLWLSLSFCSRSTGDWKGSICFFGELDDMLIRGFVL
jgi:hypothetical protein